MLGGWLILATLASPASATPKPLDTQRLSPDRENAAVRQQLIDTALQDRAVTWRGEIGKLGIHLPIVLEKADLDSAALAGADPLAFSTNPEPSSLLVWGATAMGLFATGYGVRRRQDTAIIPAAV